MRVYYRAEPFTANTFTIGEKPMSGSQIDMSVAVPEDPKPQSTDEPEQTPVKPKLSVKGKGEYIIFWFLYGCLLALTIWLLFKIL
jgi:hypothetical protein